MMSNCHERQLDPLPNMRFELQQLQPIATTLARRVGEILGSMHAIRCDRRVHSSTSQEMCNG